MGRASAVVKDEQVVQIFGRCRTVRAAMTKKYSDTQENKKTVAAVNRTRGSCMASTNFTTKPLRLIVMHNHVTIEDT